MSSISDFVIENGVLKKYVGPGGDVIIPEGVTSIGDKAFYGCSSLSGIVVPEGVVDIGFAAFARSGLSNVTLPKSLVTFGVGAFCACCLTEITIPENATVISKQLFQNCKKLTGVTISDSVTVIESWAFDGCTSLKEVTIPGGVKSIKGYAFQNCEGLSKITMLDGVSSIDSYAFCDSNQIKAIIIPDSVTMIGRAFEDDVLEHMANWNSDGLFYIGNHLMRANRSLDGVCEIERRTRSIAAGAFSSCDRITGVIIPEGITHIGEFTFCNCFSLSDVTVPEGVTSIGWTAFGCCKSLHQIRLPTSLKSIGTGAFECCSQLSSVIIPEGVEEIAYSAFEGCESLIDISLPSSTKEIKEKAFRGCSSLTSIKIPEGMKVIEKATFLNCSSLKNIIIPSSVAEIKGGLGYEHGKTVSEGAFDGCSGLTALTIPDSVKQIGQYAFANCSKLQWVKSPMMLDYSMAGGDSFALILNGEKPTYLAFSAKSSQDNLKQFAQSGKWSKYDLELINNGPTFRYKLSARLIGSLARLMDPVELTEENSALLGEFLNTNAKKLITLAEEIGDAGMAAALLSLGILDEKTEKGVKKLLAASPIPEFAALTTMKIETKKEGTAVTSHPSAHNSLQAEYSAKLISIKGDSVIKKMKLVGIAMPEVMLNDGTPAPEEIFRFLLVSYGMQIDQGYHFDQSADAVAKLLSYDSLCHAMDEVSGHLDGPNYPAVLPLLCRYGNAQQLRSLLKACSSWTDRKGHKAKTILTNALVLSDTKEAAIWLEKNDSLEAYAALRGMTIQEVYTQIIFNFGFDKSGKRVFDLGETKVEATLTPELRLELLDTGKGKIVRQIPKKDIDPALQKKAADEVADIRQNLKAAVKIKNAQLFAEYLNAAEMPADQWKASYLGNLFLSRIASLLVWVQGERTFMLSDTGLINDVGMAFELLDEPIKVAHSMEMKPEERKNWQKYFIARSLKQPFQQVWEPVYDRETLRADRYQGCRIEPRFLINQEKRGIHLYRGEDARIGYRWEVIIDKFYCTTRIDQKDTDCIEITALLDHRWDRQTNNIIAFLDRVTIGGRIRRDDLSVMALMDDFTIAQITEFIAAAQEANANNVLATLLDYKNAHFADFDPMAEFTLEW